MAPSASTPALDVPLSFVEINGARLAYRTIGDPSLPLFITLHGGRGFGSHSSDFSAYAPLSTHCRVLSPDLRGHGSSSFTPPFTFAQLVDDVEALRRHFVSDGRAIICGGSFGGYLAQQYAITYPDRVGALVLRGTAPSHEHEAEALEILQQRLARAPMASAAMLGKVFGAFKDDDEMRLVMFALGPLYAEGPYDPDKGLESARRTIYRAESHTPAVLLPTLLEPRPLADETDALYSPEEKYFDYRSRLGEITAPTLIIVGARDWICPPSQSDIIHQGVAGSELLVVPEANHSVHHEKNELVVAAILDFLTRRQVLD